MFAVERTDAEEHPRESSYVSQDPSWHILSQLGRETGQQWHCCDAGEVV